jgi:hypothetical protein
MDRIRVATLQGGLQALPPGFDDADGDWQVVTSPSLFERLYLDAAQYAAITPAVVLQNYELLRAFWSEKIAAMQTGAAKTQILIKFGGPHRSEDLVLSYPRELKKAADQLSVPNGITACHEELDRLRRESARAAVAPLLDLILANESLEPAETEMFFTHALGAGLDLEEAAALLHETVTSRDFHPVAEPSGRTLAARLRSVQWVSRARLDELQAAIAVVEAPSVAADPYPHTVQPRETHFPNVALVGTVVVIAVLFFALRHRSDAPVAPVPQRATTQTVMVPLPVKSVAPAEPSPRITPKPLPELAAPRTDTAAAELERMKREAAVLEQTRQDEAQRDLAARIEQETQRQASVRSDIADDIQRARDRIAAGDFEAARKLLDDGRTKAATDPQMFAGALTDISQLSAAVDAGVLQATLFRNRLTEIDALNEEGKFPEAMTMANRLLKEAHLPEEVATHARNALAFAEAAMKNLVKDSDLKGVRTRRTNKGRNE